MGSAIQVVRVQVCSIVQGKAYLLPPPNILFKLAPLTVSLWIISGPDGVTMHNFRCLPPLLHIPKKGVFIFSSTKGAEECFALKGNFEQATLK